MRRITKPFFIFLLVLALLGGSVPGQPVFAAVSPGSPQDPVITRSYLEQFFNQFFGQKREQINDLNRQLKQLDGEVARLEAYLVPPFPDIEGHWAFGVVAYLYRKGIVGGFDNGTFQPNSTVTRAQLATMLVRAQGLKSLEGDSPFSDLAKTHWAYGNILAARQAGFVGGYSDGTFKPDAHVTRAEIASMLTRAFSISGTRELTPFPDVADDFWAKGAVDLLVRAGITSGYEDRTFRPGNNATRAEVASFLARTLEPSFR